MPQSELRALAAAAALERLNVRPERIRSLAARAIQPRERANTNERPQERQERVA